MSDQPVPDTNGSTPIREAICAFLVVVKPDGSSEVIIDVNQRFSSHRPATPTDVYPALANALADWGAMKTAEAVIAFQQQIAQQAAMQQQAAAIRSNLPGDLRQPGA